jgi:hypothetical protein
MVETTFTIALVPVNFNISSQDITINLYFALIRLYLEPQPRQDLLMEDQAYPYLMTLRCYYFPDLGCKYSHVLFHDGFFSSFRDLGASVPFQAPGLE